MYLIGNVPYFRCLVRAEYTRNLTDGFGDYLDAYAVAVRCVRGVSLYFQVVFWTAAAGGAMFWLPIEALATKPCDPADAVTVQPWDVFSSDFGICEIAVLARGRCFVLPDRVPARYRFTIDFTGTDLADDPEQHKSLHVVFRDDGLIGAYPNNRLLMQDPALFVAADPAPAFVALASEFRAE